MFSIYSTPLKWGKAVGALPTPAAITGDAFESWEISPDSTQIALTLRQDHKFDPRPPTNGRAMTVEDVKFSWDRSAGTSGVMREILNEHGPVGPVESLETPDSRTVVIHLAFPYAPIAEMLSFWYFFIVPPEAVDQLQTDPRGSGPWQVVEHNPSGTGTVYRKNADWYETGRPYLDEVRKLQIGEYAAALAQFEAGEVWAVDPNQPILQEDILRLKSDHPELVLLQKPVAEQPMPIQLHWNFSQREDSPFKDQRLRQAAAHLYDSEAFIATFFNVKQFAGAGLPFTSVRETHLPTNSANWVDPRDPAFGPNAKYFEFDPDEAAKLIQASGFTGPFDMNFRGSPTFSAPAEVLFGMFQAGGLEPRLVPLERNEWQQMRAGGYQGYSGMLQNALQAFNDDQAFVTKYTPYGVVPLSAEPIPEISERVEQIRREADPEARNSMIKQITQDLAPLMFDLPPDSNQPIYSMHQPWLKNYNVFGTVGFNDIDNCSARLMTEFWYDESERT
jgi:peptide/nickel transport system substrate-binding protein